MNSFLTLFLILPSVLEAKTCPADAKDLSRRIVSCRPEFTMPECRASVEDMACSVVRELDTIHALVITLPKEEVSMSAALLAERPQIRRWEDDRYVENWIKDSSGFPPSKKTVSSFSMKELSAADQEQPWGIVRLHAAQAWSRTIGKGVKVAVLDTGIDSRHPDLAANVRGGVNLRDPQQPQSIQDEQGHGTHVAGIIAAARDGQGVVGVAPQAALYSVKVLDPKGGGNYSDIIAGIDWCVKNRMQVVNLSLGAPDGMESLHEAVIKAKEAGLVIVAAAGNDSGGPTDYPAAYAETIAVSASDQKDGFAGFSNRVSAVDFIAPGTDIQSDKIGGGVISHSGTSMATPHMAGLAALAIASGANGLAEVRRALRSAASPLPGLSASQQGCGLVDAGKLVHESF